MPIEVILLVLKKAILIIISKYYIYLREGEIIGFNTVTVTTIGASLPTTISSDAFCVSLPIELLILFRIYFKKKKSRKIDNFQSFGPSEEKSNFSVFLAGVSVMFIYERNIILFSNSSNLRIL